MGSYAPAGSCEGYPSTTENFLLVKLFVVVRFGRESVSSRTREIDDSGCREPTSAQLTLVRELRRRGRRRLRVRRNRRPRLVNGIRPGADGRHWIPPVA